MKKSILTLILLLLFLCACGREPEVPVDETVPSTIPAADALPHNRTIHMAVTQMLADSPLLEQLRARFESETKYKLDFAPNANSTAISVGQSGKLDALLVQKGTAASQFVTSGYGVQEVPLFSDTLLIAGPADDPAGIASADTALQAMIRIAKSGSTFVSRYDDSDVYRAEMRLWADAGIIIGNGRSWYMPARQGMAATLQLATEKNAYVLAEKEAFLASGSSLTIYMEDDAQLQNTYVLVPVSAEQFESVNAEGVQIFLDWFLRSDTQSFIRSYGSESYGCPIFDMKTTMEG